MAIDPLNYNDEEDDNVSLTLDSVDDEEEDVEDRDDEDSEEEDDDELPANLDEKCK
jgi:hypothetical protein